MMEITNPVSNQRRFSAIGSSLGDRHIRTNGTDAGVAVIAAGAAAVAYAVDSSLELGVAGGVLHVPVLLIGLRLPRVRDVLFFAGLCTALVLLAWTHSPTGGEAWKIAANRGLAIGAVWIVAGLGIAHRRSEDLFRQALASTPLGTLMVDRERRVVFANERARMLFGYDADEFLGLPIERLIPARFHEVHRGQEANFHEEGRARAMGGAGRILGLHRDGRELPLEIGLAPVRRGGQSLVLVSVLDASERARSDEHLAREHDQLRDRLEREIGDHRALFERAGGLAVVTPDGRLLLANAEATRLLALDLRSDGVARLPVPLLPGHEVETMIDAGEDELRAVVTSAVRTVWAGEAALAILVDDATEERRLRRRLQLLEPSPDDPHPAPHGLAGRVLVVDDEPTVLDLASSRLALAGLGVLSARDGLEALAHLRERGPFDVLVTDLVMPGIDGLELAAQARAIQPGIEVLVISGHGPDVLREYGLDVDKVRFLAKPFRLVELVRAVGAVIQEREAATPPLPDRGEA